MRRVLLAMAAVAVGLYSTASSAATLIGSTVQGQYYYPDDSSPYPFSSATPNPFTVGAGIDTTINVEDVTYIQADFTAANTLVLTLETVLQGPSWNSAAQNGPIFAVLSGPQFTDVDVLGWTLMGGTIGPDVAFVQDGKLFINWAGVSYADGSTLTMQYELATPLPAALPLFAAGLGVVTFVTRRRNRRAIAAG